MRKRRNTDLLQQNRQFELEVAEGMQHVAEQELLSNFGQLVSQVKINPGSVQFRFSGKVVSLIELKAVDAIYTLRDFYIPRPKALLGHQNFNLLLDDIRLALQNSDQYQTLYISAAGSDSSVMTRIKQELAQVLGLQIAADMGDLLLRIRRAEAGWQVLVRLTPRPLATRAWRVCDMPGALNAPLAHAMNWLTQPQKNDVYVNLGCGSGTLLIERLSAWQSKHVIGVDVNPGTLSMARQNLRAAGALSEAHLMQGDMCKLPLADHSTSVLSADLPFGQMVGSHEDNAYLYPAILREAARIAQPGARFVLITHEVKLMSQVLAQNQDWQIEQEIKVSQRGLHPRVFLLRKI